MILNELVYETLYSLIYLYYILYLSRMGTISLHLITLTTYRLPGASECTVWCHTWRPELLVGRGGRGGAWLVVEGAGLFVRAGAVAKASEGLCVGRAEGWTPADWGGCWLAESPRACCGSTSLTTVVALTSTASPSTSSSSSSTDKTTQCSEDRSTLTLMACTSVNH